MSYISARGRAAAESATTENSAKVDALKPFKSGTTYKVRLATAEDFVEYAAASVYKVFNTTPVRPGNLYEKAADILYKDAFAAKDAGDDAKYEELRNQAYLIKPKSRYLFGFINLEDGEVGIVDLSKAQAASVIQSVDKYAKKIGKIAFELSKQGQSTSTTVSLSPILDMDEDLTDSERKNFAGSEGKTIPDDVFESALKEKTAEEQADDLRAFGFDVSRLGIGTKPAETKAEEAPDPTENF